MEEQNEQKDKGFNYITWIIIAILASIELKLFIEFS